MSNKWKYSFLFVGRKNTIKIELFSKVIFLTDYFHVH